MRLQAAVIPPVPVLEHLAEQLRLVQQPSGQLDWIPSLSWHLELASFGQVDSSDAATLSGALAAQLAVRQPGELYIQGGGGLEEGGDDSVWAAINGDAVDLEGLVGALSQAVSRHGFFLDRRRFRPRLVLAHINASTTVEHLERLLYTLDGYLSPGWRFDTVSLIRPRAVAGLRGPRYDVLEELPVAGLTSLASRDIGRHRAQPAGMSLGAS